MKKVKVCVICGVPHNHQFNKTCSMRCQKELEKGKVKNKKTSKQMTAWVDFLWSTYIKARAGFKTEIPLKVESDSEPILNSHHIVKKPNRLLRYNVDNGICVTKGQHNYGFHGKDYIYMESMTRRLRGENIYEELKGLANDKTKVFLKEEEERFIKLLRPYKMDLIRYFEKYIHSSFKSFYKRLIDLL
jgi:predicted nucleic acid-binding Zn ribbon protein